MRDENNLWNIFYFIDNQFARTFKAKYKNLQTTLLCSSNEYVYLNVRHTEDINNKFTEHNLPLCHNSKYVSGSFFIYFMVTHLTENILREE